MLQVRPYTESDQPQWDDYVRRDPDSCFGQLIGWRRVLTGNFRVQAHYWIAEDQRGICGILPLFQTAGGSGRLFSPPGGLLANNPEVAQALLEPARELLQIRRLAFLELRDQKHRWPDLATNEEHVTLVLDLAATAEAQWKGFDAKLRNQIRKSQKAGLVPEWGPHRVVEFHRVLLENLRDLGTPVRRPKYFQRVLDCLGEAARLLILFHGPNPVGAMCTIRHGTTMFDPWASSLRRHFNLCPNEALYWEAIQEAIRCGMKQFDFGRSQRDSGTYRFKRNWGAQPVPLYYQYIWGTTQHMPTIAAQRHRYDLAVKIWRHLPLPVASFLGEYIRRRFPEEL